MDNNLFRKKITKKDNNNLFRKKITKKDNNNLFRKKITKKSNKYKIYIDSLNDDFDELVHLEERKRVIEIIFINNKIYNSIFSSLLYILYEEYVMYNFKDKIFITNKFKNKLFIDFDEKKIYRKFNYKDNKIKIIGIRRMLCNKQDINSNILKFFCDYFNINIILFQDIPNIEYFHSLQNSFYNNRPIICLYEKDNIYNPIIIKKKKMLHYQDNIISQLLQFCKIEYDKKKLEELKPKKGRKKGSNTLKFLIRSNIKTLQDYAVDIDIEITKKNEKGEMKYKTKTELYQEILAVKNVTI